MIAVETAQEVTWRIGLVTACAVHAVGARVSISGTKCADVIPAVVFKPRLFGSVKSWSALRLCFVHNIIKICPVIGPYM